MGKDPPLTNIEKGQTLAHNESKMSHRKIDNRVGRSAKVVNNFLRDPAAYGTKYKSGRPLDLDDRGRRRLFDEARKTGSSARKLQSSLQLAASVRTVQRESPSKMRLDWAKLMLREGAQWGEIIFSEEKKFNSDGLDGFQSCWYYLRGEK